MEVEQGLKMPSIDRLFLGAGAMKAGTTWLYAMLDHHPDIYFSDEKEVHYFAHVHGVLNALSIENRIDRFRRFAASLKAESYNPRWVRRRLDWYSRWLFDPIDDDWYASLFNRRNGQKYAADFSNLTALIGDAGWEHVRRIAGEVKVIYIMRDPLKRLWSHVKFHAQYTGRADKLAAMNAEEMWAEARAEHLWQNSEYGKIVATMKRHLNEDELMVVFFEDIHADPLGWLRRLETFLGVQPGNYDAARLSERINISTDVTMPEFFPQLFADDFNRIHAELQEQGVTLPAAWAR